MKSDADKTSMSANARDALERWLEWPANNMPHRLIEYEKEFNKLKGNKQMYKLYRGVSVNDLESRTGVKAKNLKNGTIVEYNTEKGMRSTRSRGLRSWTTNVGVARDFAGKNGVVLQATVNSNNVFLNTRNLERINEHNGENEIIVKPTVQAAKVIKLPGEIMNVRKHKANQK